MLLAPTNNRARGFTLIEMMVVVIIVGFMSAAITAEMHGTMQDAILRSTARELAEACRLASSRAISVNRPHRLHVDISKHRYLIERGNASGSDFLPAEDLPASLGALNPRIKIQVQPTLTPDEAGAEPPENLDKQAAFSLASAESITFYADGTADSKQMELTDQDGFRLALRVNPITSRVQIKPLEGR